MSIDLQTLKTECRCYDCVHRFGLSPYTLGMLDGAALAAECVNCGKQAIYFLPVVPKCPGTDISLTQHADGSLHWDGGTGLCGEVGEIGPSGPET